MQQNQEQFSNPLRVIEGGKKDTNNVLDLNSKLVEKKILNTDPSVFASLASGRYISLTDQNIQKTENQSGSEYWGNKLKSGVSRVTGWLGRFGSDRFFNDAQYQQLPPAIKYNLASGRQVHDIFAGFFDKNSNHKGIGGILEIYKNSKADGIFNFGEFNSQTTKLAENYVANLVNKIKSDPKKHKSEILGIKQIISEDVYFSKDLEKEIQNFNGNLGSSPLLAKLAKNIQGSCTSVLGVIESTKTSQDFVDTLADQRKEGFEKTSLTKGESRRTYSLWGKGAGEGWFNLASSLFTRSALPFMGAAGVIASSTGVSSLGMTVDQENSVEKYIQDLQAQNRDPQYIQKALHLLLLKSKEHGEKFTVQRALGKFLASETWGGAEVSQVSGMQSVEAALKMVAQNSLSTKEIQDNQPATDEDIWAELAEIKKEKGLFTKFTDSKGQVNFGEGLKHLKERTVNKSFATTYLTNFAMINLQGRAMQAIGTIGLSTVSAINPVVLNTANFIDDATGRHVQGTFESATAQIRGFLGGDAITSQVYSLPIDLDGKDGIGHNVKVVTGHTKGQLASNEKVIGDFGQFKVIGLKTDTPIQSSDAGRIIAEIQAKLPVEYTIKNGGGNLIGQESGFIKVSNTNTGGMWKNGGSIYFAGQNWEPNVSGKSGEINGQKVIYVGQRINESGNSELIFQPVENKIADFRAIKGLVLNEDRVGLAEGGAPAETPESIPETAPAPESVEEQVVAVAPSPEVSAPTRNSIRDYDAPQPVAGSHITNFKMQDPVKQAKTIEHSQKVIESNLNEVKPQQRQSNAKPIKLPDNPFPISGKQTDLNPEASQKTAVLTKAGKDLETLKVQATRGEIKPKFVPVETKQATPSTQVESPKQPSTQTNEASENSNGGITWHTEAELRERINRGGGVQSVPDPSNAPVGATSAENNYTSETSTQTLKIKDIQGALKIIENQTTRPKSLLNTDAYSNQTNTKTESVKQNSVISTKNTQVDASNGTYPNYTPVGGQLPKGKISASAVEKNPFNPTSESQPAQTKQETQGLAPFTLNENQRVSLDGKKGITPAITMQNNPVAASSFTPQSVPVESAPKVQPAIQSNQNPFNQPQVQITNPRVFNNADTATVKIQEDTNLHISNTEQFNPVVVDPAKDGFEVTNVINAGAGEIKSTESNSLIINAEESKINLSVPVIKENKVEFNENGSVLNTTFTAQEYFNFVKKQSPIVTQEQALTELQNIELKPGINALDYILSAGKIVSSYNPELRRNQSDVVALLKDIFINPGVLLETKLKINYIIQNGILNKSLLNYRADFKSGKITEEQYKKVEHLYNIGVGLNKLDYIPTNGINPVNAYESLNRALPAEAQAYQQYLTEHKLAIVNNLNKIIQREHVYVTPSLESAIRGVNRQAESGLSVSNEEWLNLEREIEQNGDNLEQNGFVSRELNLGGRSNDDNEKITQKYLQIAQNRDAVTDADTSKNIIEQNNYVSQTKINWERTLVGTLLNNIPGLGSNGVTLAFDTDTSAKMFASNEGGTEKSISNAINYIRLNTGGSFYSENTENTGLGGGFNGPIATATSVALGQVLGKLGARGYFLAGETVTTGQGSLDSGFYNPDKTNGLERIAQIASNNEILQQEIQKYDQILTNQEFRNAYYKSLQNGGGDNMVGYTIQIKNQKGVLENHIITKDDLTKLPAWEKITLDYQAQILKGKENSNSRIRDRYITLPKTLEPLFSINGVPLNPETIAQSNTSANSTYNQYLAEIQNKTKVFEQALATGKTQLGTNTEFLKRNYNLSDSQISEMVSNVKEVRRTGEQKLITINNQEYIITKTDTKEADIDERVVLLWEKGSKVKTQQFFDGKGMISLIPVIKDQTGKIIVDYKNTEITGFANICSAGDLMGNLVYFPKTPSVKPIIETKIVTPFPFVTNNADAPFYAVDPTMDGPTLFALKSTNMLNIALNIADKETLTNHAYPLRQAGKILNSGKNYTAEQFVQQYGKDGQDEYVGKISPNGKLSGLFELYRTDQNMRAVVDKGIPNQELTTAFFKHLGHSETDISLSIGFNSQRLLQTLPGTDWVSTGSTSTFDTEGNRTDTYFYERQKGGEFERTTRTTTFNGNARGSSHKISEALVGLKEYVVVWSNNTPTVLRKDTYGYSYEEIWNWFSMNAKAKTESSKTRETREFEQKTETQFTPAPKPPVVIPDNPVVVPPPPVVETPEINVTSPDAPVTKPTTVAPNPGTPPKNETPTEVTPESKSPFTPPKPTTTPPVPKPSKVIDKTENQPISPVAPVQPTDTPGNIPLPSEGSTPPVNQNQGNAISPAPVTGAPAQTSTPIQSITPPLQFGKGPNVPPIAPQSPNVN